MKRTATSDLAIILTLVLIAAFFRFYRLNELPIGLWRDEAANGLEALRVLEGDLAVFYGTQEPLFIYLVAVSIALLGRNPLAIRMVAAVAGTATIPVTYLLVKELLRSTHQRARTVAFLTSLWLATSYWHLNFSRLGFRGVLLPLFAALTFYFLWRGWNQLDSHPSRRSTYVWLALAGSCFGVTFYTYTPSRFLPLLLIPFLILAARRTWITTRAAAPMQSARSLNVPVFAALSVFVLSFVVILGPLALHFLADPKSLWVRFGVSVFGADTGEPLPVLLGRNLLRQLGMFGFLADPNTRHNPAGRPAFDLITLGLFVIGFLLSLRRWRKTPYLFCVVWFLVMHMPAILTYPELPHSLRAIGALPIAYIFPALGLEASWEWLRARSTSFKVRSAVAACLGLCLMLTAVLTYRDYFWPHVEEIELVKAFDPRFVELASLMNELDEPGAVWIIPLGPHDEQRMAYFVLDFLYQGEAPHHYVHVDETTLAEELTAGCQDTGRALVLQSTEVRLAQPWYDLYSDSRRLIPFLLDKHSRKSETLQFGNVDVLVYELPQNVVFSFPADLQPTDVGFGQGLTLTGTAQGLGSADPTQSWVVLRWQVRSTTSADFGVEVAWIDGQGKTTATINKPLLSAEMRPTSAWEPGQQEVDYYSFPGLPEPSRGDYSIHISVCPMDLDRNSGSDAGSADSCTTLTLGSESYTAATLD